jgi:hypothetical protein
MFNPNQAFLLVQKFEIGPTGFFTLGVLEKIFSICPMLLINAELYLGQEKKKDTMGFGKPICKTLGANECSIIY